MQNNVRMGQVGPWVVIGFVIFVGVLVATHRSSKSAAAAPAGQANLVMLHSKDASYCVEVPSEARIFTTIEIRNTGDAAGTVEPWATYDYSDGGKSTESYLTGSTSGGEFTVPAHATRVARFMHSYNPQQHALIRCAGFLDMNDTNASGYYLSFERG